MPETEPALEPEAEPEPEPEAEPEMGAQEQVEAAVQPAEEEIEMASEEPEPVDAGEALAEEMPGEPAGEDGSLESILADMKRKDIQE
jgi:hypothetical protein